MRPEFGVDVSPAGAAALVRVRGELDMATVPVLRQALADRHGLVVLDLRDVAFIGAAGLHLLLDVDARARQDGLDLTLVPGHAVARLLDVTGTLDRFRIRERP